MTLTSDEPLVEMSPSSTRPSVPSGNAWPSILQVAAVLPGLAAVVTVVVIGIVMFQTFFGDANIYLPFARNTSEGDFFSFNPHSFSSGATSPLWTLVLAIPFVVGTGVTGAKVFALVMTVVAIVVTIAAAQRVTGSLAAAGLAAFYLVGALALWGVVMFDSPQVVILVALSVIVGDTVVRRLDRDGRLTIRLRLLVGVTWGLLLFARPDAAILVALQLFTLSLRDGRPRWARLMSLVPIAAVAAVPSLTYYLYSQLTLGTFSVASRARAYTLLEAADRLGPLLYSRPMVTYLVSILVAGVLAALGLRRFWVEPRYRWLALYILGGVFAYVVALTFLAPVTSFMSRYFVPTAPLIVIAIARAFTGLAEEWASGVTVMSGAAVAALLAIAALGVRLSFLGTGLLVTVATGLFIAACVVIGVWLYAGKPRYRPLARYALLVLAAISLLVMILSYSPVVPIVLNVSRSVALPRSVLHYGRIAALLFLLLAVGLAVVLGAKRAARERWQLPMSQACVVIAIVLATSALGTQMVAALSDAEFQSGLGYSFNAIEEQKAVDFINHIAKPGDALLTYEVQARYFLRSDVRLISLDGLTDGIATPYLQSGHFDSFMLKYHPQFWIANDAVEYRLSLRRSFLYPIYEALKGNPQLDVAQGAGMTFRVIDRRTDPWPKGSTGWWRFIVEIQVP